MAIVIDETILLGIAGLVFVPVFMFCIRMIMKVGTLEQKIDTLCNNISTIVHDKKEGDKDTVADKKEVDRLKQQVNLLEYQVRELVIDIDHTMKRLDNGVGIARSRDRERREDRFRTHISTNEEHENDQQNGVKK